MRQFACVSWLLTLLPYVLEAAICQNWKKKNCDSMNDGGCPCEWSEKASECRKSDCKKSTGGTMGITAVGDGKGKETEKSSKWYQMPDGDRVSVDLPCMACRRGFSAEERTQMATCTDAGFEVAFCDCFSIYCSGKPPALKPQTPSRTKTKDTSAPSKTKSKKRRTSQSATKEKRKSPTPRPRRSKKSTRRSKRDSKKKTSRRAKKRGPKPRSKRSKRTTAKSRSKANLL